MVIKYLRSRPLRQEVYGDPWLDRTMISAGLEMLHQFVASYWPTVWIIHGGCRGRNGYERQRRLAGRVDPRKFAVVAQQCLWCSPSADKGVIHRMPSGTVLCGEYGSQACHCFKLRGVLKVLAHSLRCSVRGLGSAKELGRERRRGGGRTDWTRVRTGPSIVADN